MEFVLGSIIKMLETSFGQVPKLVRQDEKVLLSYDIHRHDGFEMRFILNERNTVVEQIHIVYPKVCHSMLSDELTPRTYVLYFAQEGIFYRYGKTESGLFHSLYQDRLIKFLDSLNDSFCRNVADWHKELYYLLLLLHLRAERFPENTGNDQRIEELAHYIRNFYYRRTFNIQALLIHFGCTSRKAQQLFRLTTGMRPKEFLQDVRMKAAEKLLKENRYSVKEIAALCGFADAHYFSNRFKRCFHRTPTDSRVN